MTEPEGFENLKFPDDLKYTETSEWVRLEGDKARIGVTDFAQHELTDIVYVEIPEVGMNVSKGDQFAVIESVKAAADFYAPLSGEIVEINEQLNDAPELINKDPYGDGWVVQIKLSDQAEIEKLLSKDAYIAGIKK